MNKVYLVARISKEIDYQTTANGIAVAKFSVAVQRKYANADGNKEADFINCVAWRNTADFINKYFKKGQQIALVGSLQTRTYEAQDGSKRYAMEVVVEEVEFVGAKEQKEKVEQQTIQPVTEDISGDLPF